MINSIRYAIFKWHWYRKNKAWQKSRQKTKAFKKDWFKYRKITCATCSNRQWCKHYDKRKPNKICPPPWFYT